MIKKHKENFKKEIKKERKELRAYIEMLIDIDLSWPSPKEKPSISKRRSIMSRQYQIIGELGRRINKHAMTLRMLMEQDIADRRIKADLRRGDSPFAAILNDFLGEE